MDRLFLFSTSRRGDRGDPSPEPQWGYAGPRMARMRLILTDTDGIVDSPKRDGWFYSSIRDNQCDPCHLASAVSANPHFPALRSAPMAFSGASRRKQIGGLSGSRLLGSVHEQIDRGGTGGTGGPW
jgi:hypothetical protein